MANNQNDSNQLPQNLPVNKPVNLSQAKNFNMEEIPIYTMNEDLDILRHPEHKKKLEIKPEISENDLSPKQKTSPFLNQRPEAVNRVFSQVPRPEIENNIQNNLAPAKEKPTYQREAEDLQSANGTIAAAKPMSVYAEDKNGSKLIFALYGLITILVIALISAGYYYLTLYNDKAEVVKDEAIEVPAEKIPVLSYSAEKPNYMQLEIENMDSVKLKDEIQKFMKVVGAEKYPTPIEFIVTDSSNKKVPFNEFAAKFGLNLSPVAMSNLGESFSLFIYDDTAPKLGIAVNVKDGALLQKAMLDEEARLADELNPLFYTASYTTNKLFADSEYKGAKIRFQNIIAPEILSVDYSVYRNNLVIGTTKLTMRAIIDSLEKANMPQGVSQPENNITQPAVMDNQQ